MSSFSSTHFVACFRCGVLHPIVQQSRALDGRAAEDALDACEAFLALHGDHGTTQLRRTDTESFADRPMWDPMATLTFEVTDGCRRFTAVSGRTSIEDPRTYRFAPGKLTVHTSDVGIDDRYVRRGLDFEFFPHALRPTKVDRFVATLRDIVSRIDTTELAIAFDDADDPEVSIATIPDPNYDELVTRCADIFDGWELARVNKFLRNNRGADGLLALRVRRSPTVLGA